MGYILLSSEYIEGEKAKKWHLFNSTNITDTKSLIYHYKINDNKPFCKKENIYTK